MLFYLLIVISPIHLFPSQHSIINVSYVPVIKSKLRFKPPRKSYLFLLLYYANYINSIYYSKITYHDIFLFVSKTFTNDCKAKYKII